MNRGRFVLKEQGELLFKPRINVIIRIEFPEGHEVDPDDLAIVFYDLDKGREVKLDSEHLRQGEVRGFLGYSQYGSKRDSQVPAGTRLRIESLPDGAEVIFSWGDNRPMVMVFFSPGVIEWLEP